MDTDIGQRYRAAAQTPATRFAGTPLIEHVSRMLELSWSVYEFLKEAGIGVEPYSGAGTHDATARASE